ncbi:ABC transporter permease [Acidicapsa ligni]|uniref:ABC transporter permease n=1 Tax=Acidicapsa ligni TaxID=542300 RepID=UPI0021DF605B|nr:ABC transporter permease [Acidicapsa ligni]
MWSQIKAAFRNLLHIQQVECELDDEIASYVAAVTEENIASGLAPQEARRRALAECGGTEHVKWAVRNGRAGTLIESLREDIRFGIRQLRRNPAFAWTAILTLALGIGATTAIFSAVYALLLQPLTYPGSDRLMFIYQHTKYDDISALLNQDFIAAQPTLRSFESVAGYLDYGDQNLTGAGAPMRVSAMRVTANFFPTLRTSLTLGRNFLSSEDRKDGPAVVILSHRLWQSRLNSDPAIIGRTIMLVGKAQTVVGVLPAHFIFPDSATEPDLYVPADIDTDTSLQTTNVSVYMVMTIARLRDGVTLPKAQAELNLFEQNRVKGYGPFFVNWAEGRKILAQPLQRYLTGDDREPLLILLACVAAVLLIACVNVANLQLARTVTREPEMALRGALGASRLRLIRQSLVENLTLSAIASVLGLAIASLAAWLIRHSCAPGEFSSGSAVADLLQAPFGKLSAAVEVNGWVLAFTAGLALLTTILFGVAPAIGSSRADLRTSLQGAARGVSAGRQQRRLRSVLLASEIGLAVLLLTGAGLLIRSFAHVLQNGTGFDPRQCLTAKVQRNFSEDPKKTRAFAQQILPRLNALPGVHAAAIGSLLPLEHNYRNRTLAFGDGPPLPVGQRPGASSISISPEYFAVTGTRLLQGRTFTDQDNADAVPVAIVNQAFARKYFDGNVLNKQFRINLNGHNIFTPITAVGIVQDVRYDGLEADVKPVIYLPFDQVPYSEVNILLRTGVEPASLTAALRKAVIDTDPTQPVFDVVTMKSRLSQSLAQRRLIMLLIAVFAMLAMILAGVGVYGVFSYWVSQRRQEMAIRLALGSSRGELLRLIVSQALRLILAGIVVGIAGAWFLDRLLASMLVGIQVHDPLSLSLAGALMTLVALVGCGLPARNAARTDLISILHCE